MKKQRTKNLTLIYTTAIENEHFGKDVFLVPYYLGKIFNLNVNIVYASSKTNKNFTSRIRNVTLIPKKNVNSNKILLGIYDFFYILFNAKKIDFFMRFFFSNTTAITGFMYKKLNKNGILYVKSDGKPDEWPLLGYHNSLHNRKNSFVKNIKKYIYKLFLENIDLITVETESGYKSFLGNTLLSVNLSNEIQLMYNGFDKNLFDQYSMRLKNYSEKENIILVVGRLGTFQKNTEMILETAEKLFFHNWKIVLIGPIEEKEQNFQAKIDAFYYSNPHLQGIVIFTGSIYDKKKLWAWYNNAKIFVLTSLYESFGIVFSEALFFRNYIVSTDVGAAKESIRMGYGKIIPQNDTHYLSNALQNIIDDENYLSEMYDSVDWNIHDISWERYIREATKNLQGRI